MATSAVASRATAAEELELSRAHLTAGLSCLGRTGHGGGTAFLKAELGHLGLTGIALLAQYPALQAVDLQNNRLSGLDPLRHLPHLLRLNAARNRLEQADCLEPLAAPAPLTALDLSHNAFRQVPRMSHLQALTTLNLDHNALVTLDGVEALPSLTALSARHNALRSTDALHHSPAELRRLHLDHNALEGMPPLGRFRGSLQELTLGHNSIIHLDSLAGFECLLTLALEANNVHHPDALRPLATVRHLKSLAVADNPMWYPRITALAEDDAEYSGDEVAPDDPSEPLGSPAAVSGPPPDLAAHQRRLRWQVIATVPQIQQLDGVPVTAEDKVKARIAMEVHAQA